MALLFPQDEGLANSSLTGYITRLYPSSELYSGSNGDEYRYYFVLNKMPSFIDKNKEPKEEKKVNYFYVDTNTPKADEWFVRLLELSFSNNFALTARWKSEDEAIVTADEDSTIWKIQYIFSSLPSV